MKSLFSILLFIFFIGKIPCYSQQVSIFHNGNLSADWHYSEESTPSHYVVYNADMSQYPEIDKNSLFLSYMNGGINIGVSGGSYTTFCSNYIHTKYFYEWQQLSLKNYQKYQKNLPKEDLFNTKFPSGLAPDMQQFKINGKNATYFDATDTGCDQEIHIFMELENDIGVNIVGYINDNNDRYTLNEYRTLFINHIKELNFEISNNVATNSASPNNNPEEEDNTPWTVIIGAITAAAILGIRKLLKKNRKSNSSKETKNSKKKKKEEEEEKAHYILQLNKKKFDLKLKAPDTLVAQVWKITEKNKTQVSANIQVQNIEEALSINPNNASGKLYSQLVLTKMPKENTFKITVFAFAAGIKMEKAITINALGQKEIILRTEPGNKRLLRPNVDELLTCYAKIVDDNDETVIEETEKILFKPKSDWLDLSDAVMVDDEIAINIGASNPDLNSSKIPPEVILNVVMEKVKDGEKPLSKDLKIALLEPELDVNCDEFTFPVSEHKYDNEFEAFIKNTVEGVPWEFKAAYRNYDEPDDPLTTINIVRISDTKVKIKIGGPILNPKDDEQYLLKTLVVYAWQKDEKPLERHVKVFVTREGLFITNGAKNNEISFTAKGEIEIPVEFGLFKYNSESEEILPDKEGLKALNFKLIDAKGKEKNLNSVLDIHFNFDDLVSTIPNARYLMIANKEIPGFGDLIVLNFEVSSPNIPENNKESYKLNLRVNVKTFGIGEEFPKWVEAYEQCKHVLYTHVPPGSLPFKKLNELLESKKYHLDAEGLIELRNRLWKIAYNLILAKGAKGYESVAWWADWITETLDWARWMGDLAFNALMGFYLKKFGPMAPVAANLTKELMVEAIIFKYYEGDKPIEVFIDRQLDKVFPMLFNVTKGRLISVENIQKFTKNNKAIATAVFIVIEFSYNLYQTKSIIEAAKETARQLRDEFIIRQLTIRIEQSAARRGIKVLKISPEAKAVLDDIESNIVKDASGNHIKKGKVVELMQDPAKIRTLKEYGSNDLKKAFEKTRRGIQYDHDQKLIKTIAQKNGIKNVHDLKVDDFRTPGTDGEFNLNTDRDYRVLRRAGKAADGTDIWLEVPKETWKNDSHKIFGEVSNKPSKYTNEQWADRCQQRCTDKYDIEASLDYSDHAIDPETGKKIRIEPNILSVKQGNGTLIDPEGLGKMYEQKVAGQLQDNNVPEAFAQAKKGTDSLQKVWKGYKKQGYQLKEFPKNLVEAMDIVKNAPANIDATPEKLAEINTKLNKLGYKGVGGVIKHVSDSFKTLNTIKTPTLFNKVIGYFNNSDI